jgi:hypothetical protein
MLNMVCYKPMKNASLEVKVKENRIRFLKIIKKFIIVVDSQFKFPIQKALYKKRYLKSSKIVKNVHDRKFIVRASSTKPNEFAQLCDKYGSDKGTKDPLIKTHPWPAHTYSDFYEFFFYHSRETYRNILECGIGTTSQHFQSNMSLKGTPGASLRVLRDYFPIANVYGVDIDSAVLFEEDRIKTFQMDQTSIASIGRFIGQVNFTKFDLVIDDGLHTFEAGVNLFEGIQPCLNTNFKYVIEDVYGIEVSKYVEYFAFKDYSMQVIELYREKKSHKKMGDNNLILITKGS